MKSPLGIRDPDCKYEAFSDNQCRPLNQRKWETFVEKTSFSYACFQTPALLNYTFLCIKETITAQNEVRDDICEFICRAA